ncbi:MAG: hypothetical protein KIS76_06650 [Pyrinomonadaceae bacterium]|nr:hypothetical protein [Pyrinomonadaceae bacterium]
MSDYKKRFEEWQREAKERFDDFDKQIGLKEKIAESAKVVSDTAQKGAETIRGGAEKIKKEAEKSAVGKQAVKVAGETIKTAEKVAGETVKTAGETAKKAWKASEPMRDAADDAGEKAGDVFENAAKNTGEVLKTVGEKASEVFSYAGEKASEAFVDARESVGATADRVSKAFNLGASWTRTINSTVKALQNTAGWIAEKPLQAATTGASLAVGAGLGVVFTGVSSHWFFSSFIPTSTVKRISEEFNNYLKKQEDLITKGELTKAEAERVQFEREIVKYVGAPLLGAFSFASGAVLMTNIFNPKTVTGAPVSWFLLGNPVLEGAWYFGNGLFCFKTGYDFFMISLEDDQEVQKIVKELKGLLPAAEPASV